MKTILCVIMFFAAGLTPVSGSSFKDVLESRYVVKFSNHLPDEIKARVLIISTRNFKPSSDYSLKRGLHPHYALFLFIVGLKNDTAFVEPLKTFNMAFEHFKYKTDFLVYIDGYGKSFGNIIERGFELTERFNINLVIYDWPTDYMALRKTFYNAGEVTAGFVKAMRSFNSFHEQYYPTYSVSVIFHSMGNLILKNLVSSGLIDKMPPHLFNNIIINAAAVKVHNHTKWVEKLNIQKRIYITMNERDFNLQGAMLLRMARQLGLGNRNRTAFNAYYINFSSLASAEHNLFLGKTGLDNDFPEIEKYYNMAFHGLAVSFNVNTEFQILRPSDWNFLFSESSPPLESP